MSPLTEWIVNGKGGSVCIVNRPPPALLSIRSCAKTNSSLNNWRDLMARYKSVVVLNISAFLLMLGVGMIVALLPHRIINLSGSISSVGYLASAFALTFVLLQIPIGKFSDKIGFKSFLVGGYFFCSATGLLYYFAKSPNLIYLGRMLQGIGEVPVWALAPALMSIRYPHQKGKFIGFYNASLHCGLTTGSLLGILTNKTWQGNEAFLLFAGMSFLGGLLIALFLSSPNQEPSSKFPETTPGSVNKLMSNFTIQIIIVGIVLYGAGYGIFITTVPAFLFAVKNFNQTTVGIFFGLFYIALSLSQLITGPFSDLKGRKPAIICGLAMTTIGIGTFSALKLPWLIGMLTLAAFGLGTFCISAMAFLNECAPRSLKGTISGIFYFSWGLGYFFGPLLLGKIGESDHWQMGFTLLAACFMIELIVCAIVLKRHAGTKEDSAFKI